MRKSLCLIVVLLLPLLFGSTYDLGSYSGTGGAGQDLGASVSMTVSVDDSWAALRVRSQLGLPHRLMVYVDEGPPLEFDYTGDGPAFKVVKSDVVERFYSAGDSVVVQVVAYLFSGVDEVVIPVFTESENGKVVVRQGGAGVEAMVSVETDIWPYGWGEVPYLDLTFDLGYEADVTIEGIWAEATPFSQGMPASLTTYFTVTGLRGATRLWFPHSVRVFSGDKVTLVATSPSMDKPLVYADVEIAPDLPGELKMVIAKEPTATHVTPPALYATYVAAGADVLDYGTWLQVQDETADVVFALRETNETDWDGAASFTTGGMRYRGLNETYNFDKSGVNGSPPFSFPLYYTDIHRLVPPGSTIIDARLAMHTENNLVMSVADTLFVVLNEYPGDYIWHQYSNTAVTGLGSPLPNYYATSSTGMAHASWYAQIQGYSDGIGGNEATLTARGAPQNSIGVWDPPLDERLELWDWSPSGAWSFYSEPSATGYSSPRVAADNWWAMPVRKLVNAAYRGAVNNGWVFGMRLGDPSDGGMGGIRYLGRHTTATANQRPYLVMAWIEGLPEEPLLPQDALFTFTLGSDDGHLESNNDWTATGVPYTIGIDGWRDMSTYIGGSGTAEEAEAAAAASMRLWHSRGAEIVSHSHLHATYGTAQYDSVGLDALRAGGSPLVGTGYVVGNFAFFDGRDEWPADVFPLGGATSIDSLMVDFSSDWVRQLMGPQYATDPFVGGSLFLPNNRFTPHGIYALSRMGYRSIRMSHAAQTNRSLPGGAYDWYVVPTAAQPPDGMTHPPYPSNAEAAAADSMRIAWLMHNPWQPVNVLAAPVNEVTAGLVGDRTTTLPEAELRARVRWVVARHIGKRNYTLRYFTHATKASGAYSSDLYHIDAAELAIVADEVQKLGGVVLREREIGDWMYAISYPQDVPAGWGYEDAYRWTREDGFFRRPSWGHAMQMWGGVPTRLLPD